MPSLSFILPKFWEESDPKVQKTTFSIWSVPDSWPKEFKECKSIQVPINASLLLIGSSKAQASSVRGCQRQQCIAMHWLVDSNWLAFFKFPWSLNRASIMHIAWTMFFGLQDPFPQIFWKEKAQAQHNYEGICAQLDAGVFKVELWWSSVSSCLNWTRWLSSVVQCCLPCLPSSIFTGHSSNSFGQESGTDLHTVQLHTPR